MKAINEGLGEVELLAEGGRGVDAVEVGDEGEGALDIFGDEVAGDDGISPGGGAGLGEESQATCFGLLEMMLDGGDDVFWFDLIPEKGDGVLEEGVGEAW